MIILLQSVTNQFRRLIWLISYCKKKKVIFLQSMTSCYYKVRQVLQSVTVITKWDVTEAITKSISQFVICCSNLYLISATDHPLGFHKVRGASCVQLVYGNHMTDVFENLPYVQFWWTNYAIIEKCCL